jgi:hypothetical protein
MLTQLLSSDYVVFTGAFVLLIGIGLIEAVGLGLGHFDFDAEIDATLLDWLGLGRGVPILVWLTALLACFTFAGLAIQQVAEAILGTPLQWGIAAAGALALGLVANGFVSGFVAGLFPEYETTVVDPEELLRRRATVLEGTARRGVPARAKVIDHHGQAHYIMVEPHDDAGAVPAGETGLLVRKEGPLFFVLPDNSQTLTTL